MTSSLLLAGLIASQLSARDCPDLFGDEEAVAANAAQREERLNFVLDGDPFVVVDQFHDWNQPEEIQIEDIELVDTSSAGAQLDVQVDWTECPQGLYEVTVDDSLGDDGRILATLEDGLLLEHDGELVYVRLEDRARIQWRMAWNSGYSMTPYLQKKTKAKSRRSARASKKRRK